MKKTLPKTMLFSTTFFYQFRMGLGRVWGGVWRLLSAFWATLDVILRCLSLECGWEGLLEASGLVSGGVGRDSGRLWEGFGNVLGGILEDSD